MAHHLPQFLPSGYDQVAQFNLPSGVDVDVRVVGSGNPVVSGQTIHRYVGDWPCRICKVPRPCSGMSDLPVCLPRTYDDIVDLSDYD